MKKLYSLILLFTILVSGCSQDEMLKEQPSSSESLIFTASFENNTTRTYLNENEHLRWNANDLISVFAANTYNQKYEFQGETGANSGDFEAVTGSSYPTGNELSCHYAIYPYNSSTTITENGVITATLPAEQSYAVKSFGLEANTMVAATADKNDHFLKFKNVGGYLELLLYGDNVTVKSITLTGNNNEKLAGTATITSTYSGDPTISMSNEATKNITLDCGEGIKIGTSTETATAFWLVVPPTTFESGFTITVTDINGGKFTKSTSKSIEIERNVIQPMSAFEVEIQSEGTPYLTFSADAAQTLTMSKAVATLEYTVNGSEWTELGTKTVSFGGKELGDLKIRGKSSIGTATSTTDYSNIIFGETEKVKCSGDIRTLVDYENYEKAKTSEARFCFLFKDCSNLTTSPKLPATDLADYCYSNMFNGCTGLASAPELPATTLANSCYNQMFRSCESLIKAPKLPATTLVASCYAGMFFYCYNLTQVPELPATTLVYGCYSSMFRSCTSLTTTPKLPATILAKNCYTMMFEDCSNLTTSPELPATTLADYCYFRMFKGCTDLISAPILPATNLATNCYQNMFASCRSLSSAPELPATTLANNCYSNMFNGCIGLASAPELPATTLANGCYSSMFIGCKNLTSAPELPATNLETNCYSGMFASCEGLTVAPKLPAITLANNCYSNMFSRCTSLTSAPELPATTLATSCYSYMFAGCTKLSTITMLAIDISDSSCLDNWVNGVSSTGTFTKANTMTSLSIGDSGIPEGWTVVNYGK